MQVWLITILAVQFAVSNTLLLTNLVPLVASSQKRLIEIRRLLEKYGVGSTAPWKPIAFLRNAPVQLGSFEEIPISSYEYRLISLSVFVCSVGLNTI